MKGLFLLFVITSAFAQEGRESCIPPSQPFIQERIRSSYNFGAGEQELQEIVRDEKNYALREQVKSLKRRMMFVKRREKEPLQDEIKNKFDEMVLNAGTEEVINEFPSKGSSAAVSSDNEAIIITMHNLPQAELDFIPPETLKKMGRSVSIHYKYPYDNYEYFVSYEGEEIELNRAMGKMLNEFEDACILRKMENARARAIRKKDDKDSGLEIEYSSGSGSGSGGGKGTASGQ